MRHRPPSRAVIENRLRRFGQAEKASRPCGVVRDGDECYCPGCSRRWPAGEAHP